MTWSPSFRAENPSVLQHTPPKQIKNQISNQVCQPVFFEGSGQVMSITRLRPFQPPLMTALICTMTGIKLLCVTLLRQETLSVSGWKARHVAATFFPSRLRSREPLNLAALMSFSEGSRLRPIIQ